VDRIEILHEYHFVARLIVDQLIDQLFCQQNAKAAWPHAPLVANHGVSEQILWRTAACCVMKLFQRESFPRVLDAAGYRSMRADEGNFYMLARIELCPMFHGVDQNLPECRYDSLSLCVGKGWVFDSAHELHEAIGGGQITSGRQGEPRGRPGKYFDAVVPTGLRHRRSHHFGELTRFEGSREITEGSLTHRGNHVSRSEFIGEDNQAHVRAGAPDFAKEFDILRDARFAPGDDQIECLGPRKSESVLIVNGALNAPALLVQYLREQLIDLAYRCHQERGLLRGMSHCIAATRCHKLIFAHAIGMILAAKFGPSGRCGLAPRSEAGQSLRFVLKAWDRVEEVRYLQHRQHAVFRTEEFQSATLISEGNTRLYDSAYAGTIYLGKVRQVQQQFARAVRYQIFQVAAQEFTGIPNRRFSPKVQNGDIPAFPD
jgi:hypothetical protein